MSLAAGHQAIAQVGRASSGCQGGRAELPVQTLLHPPRTCPTPTTMERNCQRVLPTHSRVTHDATSPSHAPPCHGQPRPSSPEPRVAAALVTLPSPRWPPGIMNIVIPKISSRPYEYKDGTTFLRTGERGWRKSHPFLKAQCSGAWGGDGSRGWHFTIAHPPAPVPARGGMCVKPAVLSVSARSVGRLKHWPKTNM